MFVIGKIFKISKEEEEMVQFLVPPLITVISHLIGLSNIDEDSENEKYAQLHRQDGVLLCAMITDESIKL